MWEFQSTLSVRRATDGRFHTPRQIRISIHALRKESDAGKKHVEVTDEISIHALRKESDAMRHPKKQPTR